jgi:elongation factor G
MGRIVDGTTVSDYHASEKQRQISTQTSLLHAAWMDKKFNILDTPGYLDFMSEALAALHVADFALVVVGSVRPSPQYRPSNGPQSAGPDWPLKLWRRVR